MRDKSSSTSGFGHIGTLIVIVVLVLVIGAGMYVFNRNSDKKPSTSNNNGNPTNNNKTPDPYEGWKTATLTSPQLTFKYPSDWTVKTTTDGKNIEVQSPASNNHYFTVDLIAGKAQDVNLNFLGNAPGTTISNVTVGGKPMYLVAQTAGSNGTVTGLGLATTQGSSDTSFGVIDPQKTNNVTMVASLLPVAPSSNDNGAEYAMQTYVDHPAYQTVLKIFQSLSGTLPN